MLAEASVRLIVAKVLAPRAASSRFRLHLMFGLRRTMLLKS